MEANVSPIPGQSRDYQGRFSELHATSYVQPAELEDIGSVASKPGSIENTYISKINVDKRGMAADF
jgi:hypothetical protein